VRRIRYCKKCKEYTLKEKCPRCGGETILNIPARFRAIDVKYSKYRRMLKNE